MPRRSDPRSPNRARPAGLAPRTAAPSPRAADGAKARDPRGRRVLALALVMALALLLAWREDTSLDLGFHLATGRWILQHHAWPRTDLFTYTVPGHAYIDMHGLFQIAAALAHSAMGMRGVAILREILLLATLGILWIHARRRGVRSPTILALGMALGIVSWEMRFLARPELATYLCLAAELYLLRRHAESANPRALWLVVPLQILWVNAHALSLFGTAVLGLYAASTLVRGLARGPIDRTPWWVLAAAVAALAVNPYGLAGVRFLWQLRTRIESGNVFGESISELSSAFSPLARGLLPLVAFKILLIATGVVVLLRARRLALFDLAVTGLFGVLAATRVRNIGLFVVATLPIVLEAAQSLAEWIGARRGAFLGGRRGRALSQAVGAAAFALITASIAFLGLQVIRGGWYAANQRPARFGDAESPAVYPIGTLATLKSTTLGGPLFNALDYGGYLIDHLWPREKVFIDGRLEVIGDSLYTDYLSAISGPGWPDKIARWHPNLVMVPYSSVDLVRKIHADSAWALIDVDAASVLFARRTPEHRAAIEAAEARWARLDAAVPADSEVYVPPAPRPWLARFFAQRRFPFEAWGRGNAFLVLGLYQAARREYHRALEGAFPEPVLVRNYAVTSYTLGRKAEARAWFERVVQLEPDNERALQILGELEGP